MTGSRGDRLRPRGAEAQQLCPRSAAQAASKADQDLSTWRPPAQGYRCQYATDRIADKTQVGPVHRPHRTRRALRGPQ
ncbi:hypothetical protein ABT255_38115 [Streptomyces mirabilis]|uniref:hypothetical protein n=1 Tax=Streptomyces mirabilis TaxID=68239 RepID=UPI0033328370